MADLKTVMTMLLLAIATALPAAAQTVPPCDDNCVPAVSAESFSAWRPLRIAKWSTALVSAGAALYGFSQNRQADNDYERLESTCQVEPERCNGRLPGGAYADPALEALFQDVRAHDRRAGRALVAGQVGIAASVVMFIIDLRNDRPPPNIPFDPRSLDVGPSRDGGLRLELSVPVGR